MKPHKKTLLAACAAGLLLGTGGCGWFESEPEPERCEELVDGGTLDCLEEGDEPCEISINHRRLQRRRCTYYRLGKYRIIVELGPGEIYSHYPPVENYDEHVPAREELEEDSPAAENRFLYPSYVSDLPRAVWLKLGIFDTETKKWEYADFAMYRALVSPKVTYENTVWGKLRKQRDTTYYAWHVLPNERYMIYREVYDGFKEDIRRTIEDWDPEKPVDWQPGEKEAHDALAEEVSLNLPLPGGYEAYDLGFTFRSWGCCGGWSEVYDYFPEHLVLSFAVTRDSTLLYGYTDDTGGSLIGGLDTLRFKIRKR